MDSQHQSYTEDSFEIGEYPLVEEIETILSGQDIAARQPVGKITASGKWKLSDPAAEDGSEVVRGFTRFAVDASGADAQASIIKSARLDQSAIVLTGTDHTIATMKADLEGTPLFLAPVLDQSGA
ncbi:head decoration protein [Marinicauda sp. Alg238-R41]|uniref:head decoration protein n=1 Tax=Marinicauda sp. Alg238-R41 TaxID=2993447 RepID=UPI0022E1D50A|nr:head decoration protein [Marinicauda sp. Alg238-R41]